MKAYKILFLMFSSCSLFGGKIYIDSITASDIQGKGTLIVQSNFAGGGNFTDTVERGYTKKGPICVGLYSSDHIDSFSEFAVVSENCHNTHFWMPEIKSFTPSQDYCLFVDITSSFPGARIVKFTSTYSLPLNSEDDIHLRAEISDTSIVFSSNRSIGFLNLD
jgi:hypothetical protein